MKLKQILLLEEYGVKDTEKYECVSADFESYTFKDKETGKEFYLRR